MTAASNDPSDTGTDSTSGAIPPSMLDLHDELIGIAEALDPMPATVAELATAVADPECGVPEVAEILRQDPVLTAVVLREANSAASAPVDAITAIDMAVGRLGIARVLAAAVGGSMGPWVVAPLTAYDQASGLWDHAIASSYVAEAIQRLAKDKVGPEVVTCALLHHLGQVVLDRLLDPERFSLVAEGTESVVAAERELLGVDHAELGALLLELWGMPPAVIEPVRHHHDPFSTESHAARAVYVASHVASELLGAGEDPDDDGDVFDGDAAARQSSLRLWSDAGSDSAEEATGDGDADEDPLRSALQELGIELDELREKATSLLEKAGLLGPV